MAAPLGFIRRLCRLQRIVRPEAARPVAVALLRSLAQRVAPGLPMPAYRAQSPPQAKKLIEGINKFLAAQPLEEAAYFISCTYAVLCDPQRRRQLAMYFTPPPLARHIVANVAQKAGAFENLRIMDPACGGAAFLLPAVIALRDELRAKGAVPADIIRAVNRQIAGIERDAVLAELARQFIRVALAEELARCRLKLAPVIRVGNALDLFARQRLPHVNVLLCNPPYRKIAAAELGWFRRRFPDVIVGQPNLYTMFMRAAADLVVPGGVIALLTPTSYFSGPTYEPIRTCYTRRCTIARIDLVHERKDLFLGVEHDVAAMLACPRVSRPAQQSPEVFGWNEREGWAPLGCLMLPRDGRPWHLPHDAAMASALRRSTQQSASLADYGYRVRIGAYVWNRDQRRPRRRRPRGALRKAAVPVIWATQIGQDGRFRFVSRSSKEQRARYILLRARDRRGVVERDCVVVQRTSSRAQRRRLVAAVLPRGFAKKHGGFIGENHVIVLEPTAGRPLVPRRTLARLLNSDFVRDLYSTTSGTASVTAAGLSALPLPDPNALRALLQRRRGWKRAVCAAFGLSARGKLMGKTNAKAAVS